MNFNKNLLLVIICCVYSICSAQNASVDFDLNYKITFASNKILINGQNPSNVTLYNQGSVELDISDVSLTGLDLFISTTPDYPFYNSFLQTSNSVVKRGREGVAGSRFSIDILAAKEASGNEFHPILYISSRKKPGISNKFYVFNKATNQDYILTNNTTYKRQSLPRDIVSNYANQKGDFKYNVFPPFSYSPFLLFNDLNSDGIDDFILSTNNAFYNGNFFNTGGMYLPLYKYLTKNNDNSFSIQNANEDMSYPSSQPSSMFHNVNRASIIDLNNDGKKEIIGWGEGYHQSNDPLLPEFAKSTGLRENVDFQGYPGAYNELMYLKKLTFYEISNGKLVDKRNLVPDGIPLSASLFGSAGDIDKDTDNDIIVVSDGVWRLENSNYQFSLTKILNSEFADFLNEGFQRRISTMLPYLIDINQDGYGDIIFSLEKSSGEKKPNRIVYALNNKNKGFNFNSLQDLVPYDETVSKENYLNYVLSDIYSEDINRNGTQEVVLCFAKEFSTVDNENPYPSQQFFRIVEITSTGTIIDQTSNYFDGTTNNIKVSSKNGGNFQFVNMDSDPELEIVPYFNIHDPAYDTWFPVGGWYGYWNNYTGFQYFDLVDSEYKIKRLGNIISYSDDYSTGKQNSIKIQKTYSNGPFMFHDFDKDGKNEILITGNNNDQLLQPTVDFQFNSKLTDLKENTPLDSYIDTILISSPISNSDFVFSLIEPNDFIGLRSNKLYVKAAIDFETIKTKKIVVPIKVTNSRHNTFTIMERVYNVVDVLENTNSQPSQNNFRNGVSPSTFRFLMPDQINDGYNHIMYQTEGLDALNYFGNRLEDYDLDGKFDIMMRAKEHLDGVWDLPSGNPRAFLKGSISTDFKFTLDRRDQILADGTKVIFDSLSSKKFVFSHTFQDPTPLNQIGVNNFDLYYQSKGLIKYEDYYFDNDILWFTPRVYEVSNGVINDVTKTKLIYSDNIKKDVVRFLWPQGSSTTDIDGDGDLDIVISARNVFNSIENFTNNYDSNFQNIIVYKNQGNGTLFAEIMDISAIGNFGIQEGNILHSINMDNDANNEILTSISKGNSFNPPNLSIDREFGYLDFNFQNNSVLFKKIFNASEFLEDPNWTIEPKDVKVLTNKSNRNLLLFYYSDQYGSPGKKLTGATNFNEGAIMQYFRIYEVVDKKLNNVTNEFFTNNEDKTLSLDNSGRIYLIDVDGDGITDIYPQLGATPHPEIGGISQFLKYPSWNGKFNAIYYFKQDNQGKYKLTDLANIDNFNFPQNFKGTDFKLFNDNGEYSVNGNTLRLESFTSLNTYSLNDIDNDGKSELITSWQPDFLSVFTKSNLNYSPVSKYKISESKILFSGNPANSYVSQYDFSKFSFPVDTAFLGLDYHFVQKFVVKDPSKLITHKPFFSEPKLNSKPFTYDPPFLDPVEVNSTEHLLPMNFRSALPDSNGVSYTVPFALPVQNDIYLKKVDMILSKKNFAPFPFGVIKESWIDAGNFKGFELILSNSVDINLNEHIVNGNTINGLKYGYELYVNKELKKTVIFDQNINYTYDNSRNATTITGFRIPLEGNSFSNTAYKVFALDTYDEKIKTYATKLFCENIPKPILNTSKYAFCASDTLKLSITNSVKKDKYKWYFGNQVDSSNVTSKNFLDSYKVLIVKTDSLGCETRTDTIAVTKLAAVPTPAITNATPLTFCAGQNVVLTSNGTNNQWYLNGNAIANANAATYTVNAAGTYKVKAISGDCSSPLSSAATVVVNPIPAAPTITLEANGGLTSSASDGNQWYFNDVKIDNATQKTINPTKSGNYTVKVTTPCASEVSKPYNLVVTATEETILGQVQLSPNPFTNQFKVSFPVEFGKTAQVKIVDMSGNVHFKKASVSDGEVIELGNLNGGNYILHLNSNDNANLKSIKINKIH